jgi:hypothetical protein
MELLNFCGCNCFRVYPLSSATLSSQNLNAAGPQRCSCGAAAGPMRAGARISLPPAPAPLPGFQRARFKLARLPHLAGGLGIDSASTRKHRWTRHRLGCRVHRESMPVDSALTRRLGNAGGLGIDSETEARDGDLLCAVELAEKQPVPVAGLSELSKLARVGQGKRTCPCATAQRAPPPGRSGPLRVCVCDCVCARACLLNSRIVCQCKHAFWRIPARHIRFEARGAQLPPC